MKKKFGWLLLAALLCVLGTIPFAASALSEMKPIHISLPDFQPGDTITTDFPVTCQGAVLKEISGWYNDRGYPVEEDTFGWDNYFVVLKFAEPSGKAFDPNTIHPVANNYKYSCAYYFEDDYKTLGIQITFEFVHYVYIETPDFQPGDAAITNFPVTCQGAVLKEITGWYDANGYPLTGGVLGGDDYCLRMKFTNYNGEVFDPGKVCLVANDYENGCSYFLEDNNKTLVVNIYFQFSDAIRINTPEFQIGDPIDNEPGVVCYGADLLPEVTWYTEDFNIARGYLRDNTGYILRLKLADPEGESMDRDDLHIIVSDYLYSCSWHFEDNGYTLVVDVYVSFGIREAHKGTLLNMPTAIAPGPVSDLSEVYMSGPVYVSDICWVDENKQPVMTFEEGKVYFLEAVISPQEGYAFRNFFFLMSDVGVAESSWILNDNEMIAWYPYTPAQTEITRVWITDVPRTVEMGDTLLTDLYVPTGASYTPTAAWYRLPEQQIVTEVDKNGSYVLLATVSAHEGCTFAKNVTVTVDGIDFKAFLNNGDQLLLCKAYNVGLQIIDRVDAAVTEPRVGDTPRLPTTDDPRYTVDLSMWLSSETDDWMAADACQSFTPGKYHYLLLISQAAEGYGFADDTEVYVNGRKALLEINAGNYRFTLIPYGKLLEPGQFQKGDLNKDGFVNEDDAIYLLRHVLMPDFYQVDENADYNQSGSVDEDDAIYLLRHVLMPDYYPL